MANIDYPREKALKLLYEINHKNAYTNIILQKSLKDEKLKEVDKNFITNLVYGVIKHRNYCDWIISNHSSVKLKKISPWILEILRMGVYQLFYLEKVPEFAAVNESVNLSKKYGRKGTHKFVNGVLRGILRNKEGILNYHFTPEEEMLIKHSIPKWLLNYLKPQYSEETLREFFISSSNTAPTSIRPNSLKITPEELKEKLLKEGVEVENSNLVEYALNISKFSDISELESFKEGLFFVQDEGAMLIVDVLDPKPGEKILDMCAAPGGKTTHIAEKIGDKPGLIARDLHPHRIKLIEENCQRLGLKNVKLETLDATVVSDKDKNRFDRVLLDAPCSGLGILRRKSDIKYNITKQAIEDIIALQKELIEIAFSYLKPGGVLVYSTCTINRRENEDVVKYLLNKEKSSIAVEIDNIRNNIKLNPYYIQTFPHLHQCDGFFIAKIRKDK